MTATDELRRMLDERGVKYRLNERTKVFEWRFDGTDGDGSAHATEVDGGINIMACSLTPAQAIEVTLGPRVTGETSDGYHTFNELYHHRAVLFSVIVRDHPEIAWKARAHHDGIMYDGMFIVGIETPQGQATYHYNIDPYWEMFECRVLDRAPEWDGHTPDEAIDRIATLRRGTCKMVIDNHHRVDRVTTSWGCVCSACGGFHKFTHGEGWAFCPSCGREVVEQ